jgi:hypothetical protein
VGVRGRERLTRSSDVDCGSCDASQGLAGAGKFGTTVDPSARTPTRREYVFHILENSRHVAGNAKEQREEVARKKKM